MDRTGTTSATNNPLMISIKNGFINRIGQLLNKGFSPNGKALDFAIELGNFQVVSLLIQRGADVNLPLDPAKNHIALHRAVMRGKKEIVSLILQHTADWKATDVNGASVLHLAMEAEKEDKIIDILKIFLDLGANVEATTLRGETVLFVAGKYMMKEVVKFLITHNANLHTRDCDGNSLIHCTLKQLIKIYYNKYDRTLFLKWLLSKGVDANSVNNAGESPLQLASQARSRDALEYLFKYVDDLHSFRDERNRTILHVVLTLSVRKPRKDKRLAHVNSQSDPENPEPQKACQIERMMDYLLEKGLSVDATDDEGNTVFHVAVMYKKWFAIPKLLKHLNEVNLRNNKGQTALHITVSFFNLYQKGYRDAMAALMSKGADIEIRDNEGFNPVQLAARSKHTEILRMFKERGADFKVCTDKGETLLHLYAGKDEGRGWKISGIKIFVDAGCDLNAITSDGLTPLPVAFQANNEGVVTGLIEHGADVNITTTDGITPLHLALEALEHQSRIYLHSYHNSSYERIVKKLIENGADVNARDRTSLRSTPILIAAKKYHIGLMKTLMEAGADVNAEDALGKTVLHILANQRSCNDIPTFVRAGAYFDTVDNYGYTPFYYAMKLDNYNAMAFLLEAGVDIEDIDVKSELREILKYQNICKYLTKYTCANLPIPQVFNFRSDYLQERPEYFEKFAKECQIEVKKMKDLIIDGQTSLYDFLNFSLKRKIRCLNYDKLVDIVKLSNLEKNFPLYCNVIMGMYLQATERPSLLERGQSILRRFAGFALPDICEDNIFRRLSNRNLSMLVKAGNFHVEETPISSSADRSVKILRTQ